MKRIATITALMSSAFIATAASAADLPRRERVVKPGIAPVATCFWQGAYLGAHVGYTMARVKTNYFGNIPGAPGNLDHDKFTGGLYAGYNYCVTPNLIVGIEADVTKYGNAGNASYVGGGFGLSNGYDANWGGSLRARIGLPFDRFMVYATGGIAGIQNKGFGVDRLISGPYVYDARKSQFSIGYAVGAGLEYAFTQNISARVEYIYTDVGTLKLNPAFNERIEPRFHTIRAGVAYKF
jgi:outer membrane immunogenic protein